MAPEDKLELIRKFLENRITGQEMELLYRMINSHKGEEELLSSFDRAWNSSDRAMADDIPTEKMLRQIRSQIKRPLKVRFSLFKTFGRAAVMVSTIGIFAWFRPERKQIIQSDRK